MIVAQLGGWRRGRGRDGREAFLATFVLVADQSALDKMLLQDQPQPSEDTMHDQATGYAQGAGRIADRGHEVGRQARTDETISNLTSNLQRLSESTGRLAMLAERLVGALPPRPASAGTGPAKVDREPPKFDVITNIIATEREQLTHLEAVVSHLEQL